MATYCLYSVQLIAYLPTKNLCILMPAPICTLFQISVVVQILVLFVTNLH